MPQNLTYEVNIGSGNGLVLSSNRPLPEAMLTHILVLSGNTPLPEPMLTQIYVRIWSYWATMSEQHSYDDDMYHSIGP